MANKAAYSPCVEPSDFASIRKFIFKSIALGLVGKRQKNQSEVSAHASEEAAIALIVEPA